MPEPTAASRLLLGPECSHYAELSAAQRKAYIRQLGDEQRARSRSRAWLGSLVASADVVERDRLGRPVRLRGRGDARPPVREAPVPLAMGAVCGCDESFHSRVEDHTRRMSQLDAELTDHGWVYRRAS